MPLLELHPLTDQGALAALYREPYVARVGHDHRTAAPVIRPAAHYLGARRDACRHNGHLLGVHSLGMTRNEWKESHVFYR